MYQLLQIVITLISYIIPVDRNVLIFGSWFGRKYSDNPKYLYQFLLDNKDKRKIYWYTRNIDVYKNLKENKMPVIYGYSPKSVFLHLIAGSIYCSCSPKQDLLGIFINKKTKIFNLWHGTPIKKIGYDCIKSGIGVERMGVKEKKTILHEWGKKYCYDCYKNVISRELYYIAPSQEVCNKFHSAFNVSKENIFVVGYPKLDRLIENANIKRERGGHVKKILYVPTYRGEYDSIYDILSEFGFEIKNVEQWLCFYNLELDIQLHPANELPIMMVERINTSSYINIVKYEDVYEVLNEYSYVITDFSSIYFDAIAIGVKAILAPFGIKGYLLNDRDLYYRVDEIFKEKLSYSWNELIDNWECYSMENDSSVVSRFYTFLDSKSCFRLVRIINSKLGAE
ncbi:CDP-glycerol glycerophosphotransferase family protein [Escherichia albertii]|uniref:Glycerophosphotransferase n=1 Tax=Escherichia albertii TaxID=208962 RepID=A0A5P8N568_ESCAL|nr:CDP-glycerol glycerophosphotransferase family protein [Escherichia albertii]EJZ2267905.1 CDP-glycerol glycerophosphotransferase family protein [Escherichia albertii]MCZ9074971.1 CDP-glycerol glycerophosphotransferase family protein [Escherichia albertii]MCZ9121955.1 CDP-glycerol glycerophosphotransferase family protein [Escherichia albertii]QFR35850.1 glycerophosphotransferase [Escherichia albertii]WDB98347.1 CDP-glycerol glycerophosphotransferase family protein [Escherichia albertii]